MRSRRHPWRTHQTRSPRPPPSPSPTRKRRSRWRRLATGDSGARLRTCVGCRSAAPVSELVRISRGADGALVLGPGTGRGAWLCSLPAALGCFDQATRRGALDRALRVSLGGDEVVRLRAKLEDMSG
ncbi:MAG: DUF448 domain-containing protein [Acidimicrobiia bacterium]